ncbi:MAG: hypothetical protein OXG96_07965 [Acidobacteria bacterium]|nr:hypothetical protein [Acidobacteriota bacterium]
MAKAAGLDTVLPGIKKKGEPAAPAIKPTASRTAGTTKALTVKVPPELYRRLRLHALDNDMSHQNILVAALEQYLR